MPGLAYSAIFGSLITLLISCKVDLGGWFFKGPEGKRSAASGVTFSDGISAVCHH